MSQAPGQAASPRASERFNISEEELDQLLREVEQEMAAKKRRRDNPYVLHLIKVLWGHGTRGLRRDLVIDRVFELRGASGVTMPIKKFGHAVQSAFNRHNGQSNTFNLPPEDDLFYPVGGKGSGVWAVHLNKIEPWLRKKKLQPV